MPKPNLIRNVEEIADKISRKNIKESRAIIQLGTWVKNLVDELKAMKQRLDELDIRVKKINAYGANVDEYGVFKAPDEAGVSAVKKAVEGIHSEFGMKIDRMNAQLAKWG